MRIFGQTPPMCNRRLPAPESRRLADAEFDLMMTSEKEIYWADMLDGRCSPMHKKKGAEVYR